MALNLKRARIDTQISAKGRWVMLTGSTDGDGDDGQGGEVLVARWDNPAFRALQMKLQQEYRRPQAGRKHIKGRHIPPEIAEEINFRLVSETILLGWRDIDEEPGKPLEYSKENARALLRDESLRWIFDEIVSAAMDEAAYREEEDNADAENLSHT